MNLGIRLQKPWDYVCIRFRRVCVCPSWRFYPPIPRAVDLMASTFNLELVRNLSRKCRDVYVEGVCWWLVARAKQTVTKATTMFARELSIPVFRSYLPLFRTQSPATFGMNDFQGCMLLRFPLFCKSFAYISVRFEARWRFERHICSFRL